MAAWLVVTALLLQALLGSAAVPHAWGAIDDPLALAQAYCLAERPDQPAPAPKDPAPGRSSTHDHDQCLLCSHVLAPCPSPAVALVSAPIGDAATPAEMPDIAVFRKDVRPGTPRGPPAQPERLPASA